MKILVCCKIVPEEQDIVIQKDGQLDISRSAAKISQYDLNAIECATRLAGADGEVVALSAGPRKWLDNTKIRKDILSRGPASLHLVMDDALEGAMPDTTASALALAARRIGFDLILCGEGSGDLYAQQVGLLLGEDLNVSNINAVSSVTIENGNVVVERSLEREIEVLELPLPAVLCVTSDINVPKIPTMKAILGAGKKPVEVFSCAELGVKTESLSDYVSIVAPEGRERMNKIFESDSDENIASFIELVRKVVQA